MAFMKKTRLYLIDIDLHYLEQTFQYLSATRDVEVVGYAVDAAQAQLQIARLDPDCIVLGLALRSCYGLALLRILRAIPSQPALIVCTAFPSETAMRMCRDVGADMFLSKPVTMADLHACIVETAQAKRRAHAQSLPMTNREPWLAFLFPLEFFLSYHHTSHTSMAFLLN